MCATCGQPSWINCGCTGLSTYPNYYYMGQNLGTCNTNTTCPSPYDCSANCPVILDTTCVLYHKFMNITSALTNLGIANGTTLELVLETIDTWIGQLKVQNFDIDYLRQQHVVNTLQQFIEVVDNKFEEVDGEIQTLTPVDGVNHWLGNFTSDPGAAVDGDYWYNTNDPALKFKVNGIIKIIQTL